MAKKLKKPMTISRGTVFNFKYLVPLLTIFQAQALEGYICENSLSKNGNISNFTSKQIIFKSSGSKISTYLISKDNSSEFFKSGTWNFYKNEGNNGFINLKKLSKFLEISKPNVLIRYNHKKLQQLEISPILQEKQNNIFPNATIELINPDLYVHKDITLPKSLRAVFSSNFYLEHSEKYQIPTRIRYNLKSAFIEESLMCQRELNLKFKKSLKTSSKDLTFNPEKWPLTLSPLRSSIQRLLIERYLFKSSSNSLLVKYHAFLKGYNLSKILKLTKEDYKSINQQRLTALIELNNSKIENKPSNLKYVTSISKSERVLFTSKIDNSELADDKDSFIIRDFLDKRIIENVTTTLDSNNKVSFYFESTKYPKKIKIGPVYLNSLYRRNISKPLSTCSERVRTHLSEYERKSYIFKRSDEEFINLKSILFERKYKQYPLNEFVLTNNCRGAGNFEFEWPGLIKGHFHVPVEYINQIIDMRQFHTEDRMTKAAFDSQLISSYGFNIVDIATAIWSKYKEKEYQWKSLGNFDKASNNCNIKDIEKDLFTNEYKFKEVKFKYEMGRIHYDQFPTETRKKAGYNSIKTPLSYVKTPCDDNENRQAPPKHFYPPKPYFTTNSKKYWHKKTCSIVPINFFYYKDLLDYKVHLSKFEVDGVYIGSNRENSPLETTDYDQSLLKNDKFRVKYDFKNIYQFKNVSVSNNSLNNTISIKLESKNLNLIIANIDKTKLALEKSQKKFKSDLRPWATDNVQGVKKLIGIMPFDLGNTFVENPISEKGTFSLFYNKNGKIRNHHETDIGIEQWILRSTDKGLTLDLISHERITPVARILIDYKL
jgi:hypothetical protein